MIQHVVSAATRPTVGVDVGGTTVKGLLLSPEGQVLAEQRRPTPAPDPTGVNVVRAVHHVANGLGHRYGQALGVAVPGIVDEASGTVQHAVNLDWHDLDVIQRLREQLGDNVVLAHDVRAGAVAETRIGAAAGMRGTIAFVAVGTGIAAGLIIDGTALSGGGWAGEIGQLLLAEGPFAGCRVEEVASAAATARRAGAPDARTVAAAVRAGEPVAAALWEETVDVLGQSLAGLVSALAPASIVIGGGLALAGDLLLEPLEQRMRQLVPTLRVPRLLTAIHGDRAAAIGAALLATEAAAASRAGAAGIGETASRSEGGGSHEGAAAGSKNPSLSG